MKIALTIILQVVVVLRVACAANPAIPPGTLNEVEENVLFASAWTGEGGDSEEYERESIKAKRRIGEIGEVADYAVAEIIVLGIAELKTLSAGNPSTQARDNLSRVMATVRNDPKLVTILLPVYESGMAMIATGDAPHRLLDILDEATVYILRWGSLQENETLKQHFEKMRVSENANVATSAGRFQQLETRKNDYALQRSPKLPFHQWCRESVPVLEWDRAHFMALYAERVPGGPDPMEEFKRKWGAEPPKVSEPVPLAALPPKALLTGSPSNSSKFVYPWVALGILVSAVGILWLVFRRKGASTP